jgi:HlyD family secretion protein
MKYAMRFFIFAGLAATLGLGIYGFTRYTATKAEVSPDNAEATIEQKTELGRIGALGRLEPEGEVVEIGAPPGSKIELLLVTPGQEVSAGTELVRLDSYEERLAARDYAAAQLAEARIRLKAEIAYRQRLVQEARTRIEQIDRPGQAEIEAQKATIRQFQAELEDAKINQERIQKLLEQGAVSAQEYDTKTLILLQKQEALQSAQATLTRLEKAWEQNLVNAQAQVESAEAQLALAPTEIQLLSLEKNLQLAEARLKQASVRAPQSGRIMNILRYPGEVVDSNEGILEIGNTQQMMVVAEVYETDIHKVKLGQSATIRSDAFSETLTGTVDHIGLQINKKDVLNTDPAADVDARVIEVKIRLDPESSQQVASLTNLQVTVTINTSLAMAETGGSKL